MDNNYPLNTSLFKLDDVYETIEHCNFGKAIGPDMFVSSVLKDTVIKSNVAAIITVVLNSKKISDFLGSTDTASFARQRAQKSVLKTLDPSP